jgi:hypothetical protein
MKNKSRILVITVFELPFFMPRLLNGLEILIAAAGGLAAEIFQIENPFAQIAQLDRHGIDGVVFFEEQFADFLAVIPIETHGFGSRNSACETERTASGSRARR